MIQDEQMLKCLELSIESMHAAHAGDTARLNYIRAERLTVWAGLTWPNRDRLNVLARSIHRAIDFEIQNGHAEKFSQGEDHLEFPKSKPES